MYNYGKYLDRPPGRRKDQDFDQIRKTSIFNGGFGQLSAGRAVEHKSIIRGIISTSSDIIKSVRTSDKNAIKSILKEKIENILTEKNQLMIEYDKLVQLNSVRGVYYNLAKKLANVLNEMQGKYNDMNIAFDKHLSNTSEDLIKTEIKQLKINNENLQYDLERLYHNRSRISDKIIKLQNEIAKVKNYITERIFKLVSNSTKIKIENVKELIDNKLQLKNQLAAKLKDLTTEKKLLEEKLYFSNSKLEAVKYYYSIIEYGVKLKNYKEYFNTFDKTRLTDIAKFDESAIEELNEKIKFIKNEIKIWKTLTKTDNNINDLQFVSKQNNKISAINSLEEINCILKNNLIKRQNEITKILSEISNKFLSIPQESDYRKLLFKTDDEALRKFDNAIEEIKYSKSRLFQLLFIEKDIERKIVKITKITKYLKVSINDIKEKINNFGNVQKNLFNALTKDKQNLKQQTYIAIKMLEGCRINYTNLLTFYKKNENVFIINNLMSKLTDIERDNFNLAEYLSVNSFSHYKDSVYQYIRQMNKSIISGFSDY